MVSENNWPVPALTLSIPFNKGIYILQKNLRPVKTLSRVGTYKQMRILFFENDQITGLNSQGIKYLEVLKTW